MAAPISMYQATLAGRREVYNAWLAAGKGTPFIYPWDTLPALYLFVGIVIRPYLPQSLRKLSGVVTLAAVVLHSLYICINRRTMGLASGYGIGLISTWGTIMAIVLLIVHEPEKDYVRLEIREASTATTNARAPEGLSSMMNGDSTSKQIRNRQDGSSTQASSLKESKRSRHENKYRLIWQPFPTEIWHSMEWSLDLMSSFRGPNWNYRIPTMSTIETIPPPKGYKTSKRIEATMLANEFHNPSDPQIPALDRSNILEFLRFYVIIDLTKTIMITDPYFLGLRSLDSPSPWPIFHDLPIPTKLARLVIALAGVVIALRIIFSLAPLFFYTILSRLVSQQALLKVTKAPFYDPRMYGHQFTSPFTTIPAKGLAGFWGQTWHQMFRYGISEPSIPLIAALGLPPRSQIGRAIQLLVAFGFTGLIHTIASYTTFSIIPSKPLDPGLFFILQAVGIITQTALSKLLQQQTGFKPSAWVKQVTNTLFVIVWLWFTGPLLADDFARAGIWLFEPVPVSFLRGITGQGWWAWNGRWASIQKGDSVFTSGIVVF